MKCNVIKIVSFTAEHSDLWMFNYRFHTKVNKEVIQLRFEFIGEWGGLSFGRRWRQLTNNNRGEMTKFYGVVLSIEISAMQSQITGVVGS